MSVAAIEMGPMQDNDHRQARGEGLGRTGIARHDHALKPFMECSMGVDRCPQWVMTAAELTGVVFAWTGIEWWGLKWKP